MAFDLDAMIAATADGPVVRVLITGHKGSAPRHAGTTMLVWAGDTFGTIGGGALELQAIAMARDVMAHGETVATTIPLGPALGQCCGGSVSLVIERFDAGMIPVSGTAFARPISKLSVASLAVKRAQASLRNTSEIPNLSVIDGWLIEPIKQANPPLWLYGAGHVGRAIVDVLDGLDVDITWVDTSLDRFPMNTTSTTLVAKNPADVVQYAPANADHLIMTYSHKFDFDLCHQILSQPHRSVGVIGSNTKWVRFRKRLLQLGHNAATTDSVICPIGDPSLGNEPKSIAIGVAAQMIRSRAAQPSAERELK